MNDNHIQRLRELLTEHVAANGRGSIRELHRATGIDESTLSNYQRPGGRPLNNHLHIIALARVIPSFAREIRSALRNGAA